MVRIEIRGAQGYIADIPPEINDELMDATSFQPVGYEYTRASRKGGSGAVHLLKNSKFPPGLLERITEVLESTDTPYEVVNFDTSAAKPKLRIELDGIESRDYQDEAVETCALRRRGVVQAPTGSGKSAIIARVIQAKAVPALIIVPTIDLLYQLKGFLDEHMTVTALTELGVETFPIGQLGDGVVDPQPVTIATVRTAAKVANVDYIKYEFGEYDDTDETEVKRQELRTWIESIGTVGVDEAHILGASTVFNVCRQIPAINFFGFSASPWRDDNADLMIEAATGRICYKIGTKILVDQKWLVPPIIRTINTQGWWQPAAWSKLCKHCKRQAPTWASECKTCKCKDFTNQFNDCYKAEIVENTIRNAKIAEIVYEIDEPTLVLVKQVKHGRILQSMIQDSVFLSGKDSSQVRNQAFADVRSGKIKVVVATTIADMGLDLPILSALVLAGGGKSSTRHLQRIGRVVRPYKGKKRALVVDLDDTHVARWFGNHVKARRAIEQEEWADVAVWL